MEQILYIENKRINFTFNEQANCWQTKTTIDYVDVEIEIDFQFHKEKEVDWMHFKDFFVFVNKQGRLKELIEDAQNLVSEVGKAFFRDCQNEVSDFKMVFDNAIFYKGQTDGTYIKNGYSYSLIFTYYVEREGGVFADDYGLYLVDIENHFIVGARRHQC